jgi:hypothetical protein
MIRGLAIFYPDGTPTQRVGIRVDVLVRPTIRGIAERRDEVIEAAIRQIAPELPLSDVEKLARTGPKSSQTNRAPATVNECRGDLATLDRNGRFELPFWRHVTKSPPARRHFEMS